jgi:hypothetical protein
VFLDEYHIPRVLVKVSQYIVNRREAERRPLFVRFMWCFPGRGDPEMEQRDWELLDKQVRGLRPPQETTA